MTYRDRSLLVWPILDSIPVASNICLGLQTLCAWRSFDVEEVIMEASQKGIVKTSQNVIAHSSEIRQTRNLDSTTRCLCFIEVMSDLFPDLQIAVDV